MSKVRIVQIACASGDEYSDWQYLDDKGRVWADRGHNEKAGTFDDGRDYFKYVSNWEQIDMPDEPEPTE